MTHTIHTLIGSLFYVGTIGLLLTGGVVQARGRRKD